jgi:energy-coupling factor transporter transmembrane protein EcfT
MILKSRLQMIFSGHSDAVLLGPLAYLAVFAGSLGLILFAPPEKMLWAAGCSVLTAVILYPAALLRIFRPRWLLLIALLVLATTLTTKPDSSLMGIAYSRAGLLSGLQMALRAVVIFVAVDGLAGSMDISVLAGLLERAGLRGLGFSVGVAMNLLLDLRQSIQNTWHSLWMRGGLRQQRGRALKYFLTTVMINALRQGEEIALAAEARAYTPERARVVPVGRGSLDSLVIVTMALTVILFFIFLK